MNKQRAIRLLLIAIFSVIVISAGVSYAFFTAITSSGNNQLATSGNLNVIYLSDGNISGNLIPALNKDRGLSTTAEIKLGDDSVSATATLALKLLNFPCELAISGLKWEVYKDGLAFTSGTFAGFSEGESVDIVTNYSLTTTNTIFTIYVWLNGNESDNSVMNKTFSGILTATTDVGTNRSDTTSLTGANSLTFINGVDSSLADYKIYGNGIQETSPTPSSPMAIQTLGTYNSTTEKYDITITNKGKNMFDYSLANPYNPSTTKEIYDGKEVFARKNSYSSSNIWPVFYTNNLELIENNIYTLSFYIKSTANTTWKTKKVYINSQTSVSHTLNNITTNWQKINVTFTYTGSSNILHIYPTTGDYDIYVADVQVELGSADTTYESYANNTYTISLDEPLRCIDNVCDYIDYKNQRVVRNIHRQAFTGNETFWRYSSNYSANNYYSFSINGGSLPDFLESRGLFMSNYFEKVFNNWNMDTVGASTGWTSNQVIWFKTDNTVATSLATWKQWLINKASEGNPLEIYYQLKIPVYEAIDLPTIATHKGTNIITINDGGISPSKIDIDYYSVN